jgi:sugar phosphate permease
VLWGFPYLTQGLGYSSGKASALMLLLVLGGVFANLAVGQIVGRRPEVRTPMAVLVCCLAILAWLTLIGWPGGQPPLAVVVVVVIVFSISGPTSSVAFMLARDYNPRHRISTATGLVNIGGFCGAVIGIFLVGQILDLVEPTTSVHSADAFRFAFVALVVLTGIGLARMLTWWLRTRAMVLLAAARGEEVPVQVNIHRWELVDEAELALEAERARAARRADHAQDDRMDETQDSMTGGTR